MSDFCHILSQLIAELSVPSPTHSLSLNWPGAENVDISIKRDDQIHPIISGNKWRKLAATFVAMKARPARIISFGGGFSNHLHALGYLCYRLDIPFTALIRGDYTRTPTPMINDLMQWQADIEYVTKRDYQRRHTPEFTRALTARFPDAIIIPEGGSQHTALEGVRQIILEQPVPFDTVLCPVASGATLAGISSALSPGQHAIGVGVLNGAGYLESLVEALLVKDATNWHIEHAYTHGGYAKKSPQLLAFCEDFQRQTDIDVEPVYSGKLLFALKQMLEQGYFAAGHRILIVHTGGLQGARIH